MNDPFHKPLNADQIEALLRSARDQQTANRADFVSNEPLGPGDVQHLRNTAFPKDVLAEFDWPGQSADELLHQAQHDLAEAMSTDVEPPTAESAAPKHPFLPLPAAQSSADRPGLPLSVLGDIELDVTLELGQAELKLEELLALREGSVVTLDKEAGEPIDILANGKLIARGEVIVVDDKFCVRICEVMGAP